MLLFIEMSCNRTGYIIPFKGAPMFNDVLFKTTRYLTYIYFTIWARYHIDNIFCFTGNKSLNVNGLSIGRMIKGLKVFVILAVYAGSTLKAALKRFSCEITVQELGMLTCSNNPVPYVSSYIKRYHR